MEKINQDYKVRWGKFLRVITRTDKVAPTDDLMLRAYEVRASKIKRFIDIITSIILIILVYSWVYPIIAAIIKYTSRGPIIFKQKREGVDKKVFYCYKFRTMVADSRDVDASGKYLQATWNDRRITKIGFFLRKTSLDELPQLINVLKGDMSLVGPRPHPIPLNREMEKLIQGYNLRHLVKPGITGLAQISGYRGETKLIEDMRRRVEYDINYIKKWKGSTDFVILYKTIINIITGDPQAY